MIDILYIPLDSVIQYRRDNTLWHMSCVPGRLNLDGTPLLNPEDLYEKSEC